jgi:hypothetical protein
MEFKLHRRTAALIAIGSIATCLIGPAYATTASAGVGSPADDNPVCTSNQGKYNARLVTSYPITGGNESEHGIPGGTLQLWASDLCGTAWVKTVKLPQYADQPQFTAAGISSVGNPEQKNETVTSADLESPAVPTGRRSGELHVEGGFLGGDYQFDSAHTFKY